jgi:hypothetical protein
MTLTINSPGVLANDTDIDGDPLSAILVAGPAHGALNLSASGSFTYTPGAGFIGIDTFTYRPADGLEMGDPVTVRIGVRGDVPLADNDPGTVDDSDAEDVVDENTEPNDDQSPPSSDSTAAPAEDPDGDPRETVTHREPGPPPVAPIPTENLISVQETSNQADFYFAPSSPDDTGRNSAERDDRQRDTETASRSVDTTPPALGSNLLWGQLDAMQDDLHQQIESQNMINYFVVGTAATSVTGLTVGYVIWLVRGGSLLASMISSLPAWMAFDPLPVLDNFEDSRAANRRGHGESDISFESLVT